MTNKKIKRNKKNADNKKTKKTWPFKGNTITILRWREVDFEKYHGVTIYDTALTAAVNLSERYITDRKLPDKAINVLDQAATKVKIAMTSLPEYISDMQVKIWQITREKNSMTQELSSNTNTIVQTEFGQKIRKIDQEIDELNKQYTEKKTTREKIKTLFEANRALEWELQEGVNPIKGSEKKNSWAKAVEAKQLKTAEIQKTIKANQEEIIRLQTTSGIMIKNTVEIEDVAKVISDKTGIPLTKMIEEESQKLANLETYLSAKVIGQSDAIAAVSNAIRRARIGLKDPKKPIGSFLFLWPTGVGKTELAKALAEFLFFDKKSLIRLNMSEYQEEHSVSKLIGSPPWYVGYEQWGQLTEAVKRKPYSVIDFDEVEKAHPKVFDLLLQVLDDGMLNDSMGNTIDFKNTIIIMTSNIGSREIMEKLQGSSLTTIGDLYPVETIATDDKSQTQEAQAETPHKRHRRGKKKHDGATSPVQTEELSQIDELKEEIEPILMEFFRPEFLNRLDGREIFNPISPEMLKNILDMRIKEQCAMVYASNKITLTFTNQAKNFLAKKWRDPANGARPINRALQNYIIDPLAKEIVSCNIKEWASLTVDVENDKIVFKAS